MTGKKLRTKRFEQTGAAGRRDPSTDHYCVRCRRDIAPGQAVRHVHLVDGGALILHPDDEGRYESDAGDVGCHPVGPSCAKMIGLAWSVPMAPVGPTPSTGPDAECTECGDLYYSGDGPAFNIAICPKCFASGSTGPLGIVT